ncbi:Ribosomal protein L13 [Ignavibacterium album JCM 16511]|uniref:Large ribosomal subunit protein uL13 n=2 Tax=Ignavibacterium album TaxID=591197 RepID=I0AHF1_IGNAJ|nr:Ribosomal protein L13 [Ignavibacterium album JCM 16511]
MKQEKMTKFIKSEDADKKWYLVDAKDQVLGRLASQIAKIIRGKNKPTFTPNMDTGDFVVVINADKVKLTGKRPEMKQYIHHSGYPGGQKIRSVREVKQSKPEFLVENAVKGMLPKNRLGRKLIKKLKVYTGESHPHSAQKPEPISFTE